MPQILSAGPYASRDEAVAFARDSATATQRDACIVQVRDGRWTVYDSADQDFYRGHYDSFIVVQPMSQPNAAAEARARVGTAAVRAAIEFAGEAIKLTEMQQGLYRHTAIPRTMRAHLAAMELFCKMIEE